MKINRIHHISVLAGEPQRHYDFYTEVLGLRLIKKTVNFDNPAFYHLYFSSYPYNPNFIFTSFPSTKGERGRLGGGQVGRIAFSVPQKSFSYWTEHFNHHKIDYIESHLFGLPTLEFSDPDGLELALVENSQNEGYEIDNFYGIVLHSRHVEETKFFLKQIGLVDEDLFSLDYHLYSTFNEEKQVVLLDKQAKKHGWLRAGTVHHIAWAVPDASQLNDIKETLEVINRRVTDVKDRKYFKSIYSREPGHTLFEYATDGPGFLIDEPLESLGSELKLPVQYQDVREKIIARLPELKTD